MLLFVAIPINNEDRLGRLKQCLAGIVANDDFLCNRTTIMLLTMLVTEKYIEHTSVSTCIIDTAAANEDAAAFMS